MKTITDPTISQVRTWASDVPFPEGIVRDWRVIREQLAEGDAEYTIPLTGDRGHVYFYGPGWAGVWLNTGTPEASMKRLAVNFSNLIVQQVGLGECTFRVPFCDLDRLLPALKAYRRRRLSDKQRATVVERLRAHQFQSARTPEASKDARIDATAPDVVWEVRNAQERET